MKHYKNFSIQEHEGTHIARQDEKIIGSATKEHHLYQLIWQKDGGNGKNSYINKTTFKEK